MTALRRPLILTFDKKKRTMYSFGPKKIFLSCCWRQLHVFLAGQTHALQGQEFRRAKGVRHRQACGPLRLSL